MNSNILAKEPNKKYTIIPTLTNIIKLNDSIFYERWEDYFNSLLLHNFFFSSLAYGLLGFHKIASTLYAVVKQQFVRSGITDLENVRVFLKQNGFINKKGNDYYTPELGLY
jgi:hypothetical protein